MKEILLLFALVTTTSCNSNICQNWIGEWIVAVDRCVPEEIDATTSKQKVEENCGKVAGASDGNFFKYIADECEGGIHSRATEDLIRQEIALFEDCIEKAIHPTHEAYDDFSKCMAGSTGDCGEKPMKDYAVIDQCTPTEFQSLKRNCTKPDTLLEGYVRGICMSTPELVNSKVEAFYSCMVAGAGSKLNELAQPLQTAVANGGCLQQR
eukprot:TRINITY_DN73625_c0_g1_i1.p1 TRINITY_DN73625_c0_g1~~TRINITY_DN73625_c0_g1_i1.p1  ORF type:complete len:209 (-),score=22.04 TRINITY_DN73625_c0_g1_i1:6-632(-)